MTLIRLRKLDAQASQRISRRPTRVRDGGRLGSGLVDADDVIRLELVGSDAVADAGHHDGGVVRLLYEVLGADQVEEFLADLDFAEVDAALRG